VVWPDLLQHSVEGADIFGRHPLTVNSGGAPTTVLDRNINTGVKWAFSFVPSGTFKIGYDIIPDERSLYFAYNYLYMSSVGLIAYQFPNPGIKQASFFAQGITVGFKEKF
jgi:hypothetical protein